MSLTLYMMCLTDIEQSIVLHHYLVTALVV